ncbi:Unknown protein sequence [Pseudomonas syringae pv. cilantro]|uniref:Uncharacterized protein n=1 Tax=Pseudomonas syringae pv. cilantro TaxID=81035 RepID=A0A0N0XB71_PSESX|nr:Unknown protein sequence [Pseudomonas syringae pv. cilantro]
MMEDGTISFFYTRFGWLACNHSAAKLKWVIANAPSLYIIPVTV